MINILIVEDNSAKREKIKESLLDGSNIRQEDIVVSECVKEARKALYEGSYDLLILDLVLPIEIGEEVNAKNGVDFLNEIQINPMIHPPIHIVGLSGYSDEIEQYKNEFNLKLWSLIPYDESSTGWQDSLRLQVFHLVKIRQQFLASSINNQLKVLFKSMEDQDLPNTFLGNTLDSITRSLGQIVGRSLAIPSKFSNGSKAKNINSDTIRISSEYDFQNLTHLVLRPWLPSLEPENIAVIFDGNTKNADFSIRGNLIIVEAKYIDTNGKKNDVLKTLEGLSKFYAANANVKSILFLILVDSKVSMDANKIETTFSKVASEPCVHVRVFSNELST